MSKVYKKFKAKLHTHDPWYGDVYSNPQWTVVTDDKNQFVVASIPNNLRHPEAVAKALSSALTNSKLALTDLI